MKTMKMVAVAVAVLGGCAAHEAGQGTDEAALTGSGVDAGTDSGSGTGSGSGSTGPSPVWHSVWNGGNASAWLYGWYTSGNIDAYENVSGPNRVAYLNYAYSSVDPSSLQCYSWTDWWGNTYQWCYYTRYTWDYGWGQIPTNDFQVTPKAAHVKTVIGSNPSFYAYHCSVDYSTWTFDCGVPVGGTVDVTWSKDGQWSSSHSGTDQTSWGPYTFQTSGTWSSSSAHASGSIIGTTFDAFGGFGDTHRANVTKDILNTPHP